MPSPQHSLLLFQLVGGCEFIKQLPIHLHKGLEHVVDQRYDGSWQVRGGRVRRGEQLQFGPTFLSGTLPLPVPLPNAMCSHECKLLFLPLSPPSALGCLPCSSPARCNPRSGLSSPGPNFCVLWVRSRPGHSLIPVLLGDLVEGPKDSRQHSVAVVLNEAQDILIVPEIQSPLCNLGQRDGRVSVWQWLPCVCKGWYPPPPQSPGCPARHTPHPQAYLTH